jgi:phosphate transport system permease protein
VVLGIARAVGETAPLLFTSFGYNLMNANPFSHPQESLPLFVYTNVRAPDLASIARGYTGALVLLALVLSLFIVARVIGRDRSRRTRRRRSRPTNPTVQESTAT